MNLSIGDFQIYHVRCEDFKLDGGTMFGIVPKVLWEKTNPSDGKNRICMTSNCLLVTDGRENIIVEAGLGHKEDEKFASIYAREGKSIDAALGERGVSSHEIDHVILSHLHFDHCGGAVTIDARGELIPTFPNAQHYVQRRELHAAMNTNEKTRGSYLKHNIEPLIRSGQLKELDGNAEICPGISVFIAEGHTEGMQCTLIQSGKKKLFFAADLFPLKEHVNMPTIMSYDLFPLKTLQTKKKILPRALAEEWCIVFAHDPETPFGFLEEKKEKIAVRPMNL